MLQGMEKIILWYGLKSNFMALCWGRNCNCKCHHMYWYFPQSQILDQNHLSLCKITGAIGTWITTTKVHQSYINHHRNIWNSYFQMQRLNSSVYHSTEIRCQGCEFFRQTSYLLICLCNRIYFYFLIVNFTGRKKRQSERVLQPDLISNSWTKWWNHCCWLPHPSILCKRGLPWWTLSRRKRLKFWIYLITYF